MTQQIGKNNKTKKMEVISKTGKINNSDERIFNFFSDFRNISKLIPPEVENWQAEQDWCSFTTKGQNIKLIIIDKEEFKTIKISGDDNSPYNFNLWIQLKQITAYETAVRLVVRADLNMIMRKAVKKPLQKGLDQMIDYMKMLPY